MEFLEEFKRQIEPEHKEIQPQHILAAGAGLEILREIKERLERMENRIVELERKIEERIPGKALTAEKFEKEIESSDEFVEKILAEVRNIARERSVREIIENRLVEEKPTLIEMKRMENVRAILQKHGKLTSAQLAQLMNLSRTRANEYFKIMEDMEMVKSNIIGKEKYYSLIPQNEL